MDIYGVFGHLAFILIAFSYLVKDILWLRLVSIVASIAGIVYNYFVPATPLWLVINWNIVFILINLVQISILARERMNVAFTEEEKELYGTIFRNYSPVEFMKLMRIGEWKDVGKDEVLTQEGQNLTSVMLLYNGSAKVRMKNEEVSTLKDGHFIGEMSFITNEPASATVVTAEPTRLVVWSKDQLKRLLNRNPSMRISLQSVLSANMAKKLQQQPLEG